MEDEDDDRLEVEEGDVLRSAVDGVTDDERDDSRVFDMREVAAGLGVGSVDVEDDDAGLNSNAEFATETTTINECSLS